MAKWGEGDPRWIVEERTDGTNVGNWHWTEKNATPWSKDKLRTLLSGLAFEGPAGTATVTKIKSIDGEATINNRKSKLVFFYEFTVDLEWKGETADGQEAEGAFHVPNLSEEYDADEIDVDVSMKSKHSKERDQLKRMLMKEGLDAIRDRCGQWISALKTEYTKGMVKDVKAVDPTARGTGAKEPVNAVKITPGGAQVTKAAPSASAPAPAPAAPAASKAKKVEVSVSAKPPATVSTKDLTCEDSFSASACDVFKALVEEDRVKAYTQSDASIDAKVGGKYTAFSGNVEGIFKDLVPYERIKMAWRFKHWTENHYSEVTIGLSEGNGKTHLTLKQTGVPVGDFVRTKEGWNLHYFQRMKAILGMGAGISMF